MTQMTHLRKSQDKSTGQTRNHVTLICVAQRDPPTVHCSYTQRSSALLGLFQDLPSISHH